MARNSVLWRKLDQPGHEACRLSYDGSSRHLAGAAVFLHERQPCCLEYHVVCDAAWRTGSVKVAGWVGDQAVDIRITADSARHWHIDGAPCPGISGCIDADLNFSPSTNLLPLRRLNLSIGEKAEVRAAWLRFPEFTLEPLEQSYHRISGNKYRYTSGSYTAELHVDRNSFITRYPGLWQIER